MPQLPPIHEHLTFLSPMSEERSASLVRFVADGRPGTVLDIGCGWGELLLRTLSAIPDAEGLGVDLEARRIHEARRRAAERGLAHRASFEAMDARGVQGRRDAVVCIGASQVWGPPVEDGQPLDYRAALLALRELVNPGGRLVYGEAIWDREPTAQATGALSGRDDEYASVDDLVSLVRLHGFGVEGVGVASQQEWDEFESGFVGPLRRWLADHPVDHPEAASVRQQLDEQRSRYVDGYRGVLGMAYLHLVAL